MIQDIIDLQVTPFSKQIFRLVLIIIFLSIFRIEQMQRFDLLTIADTVRVFVFTIVSSKSIAGPAV